MKQIMLNDIDSQPNKSCFYMCLVDQHIGKDIKGIWKVVYWDNEKKEWNCPFRIIEWKIYPPKFKKEI